MYIFYDFETSSRDLIGQIISYAFVLTDDNLKPIENLTGKIKLNRTQCPEVDALLVNKIQVSELQDVGLTEYEASKTIFDFLNKAISNYGECCLVGYNSNQFDIGFLRTLFIRYGINPYFEGKLKNLDILHYAQYLAFYYPAKFPWVQSQSEKSSYYSFKLEDLTSATGLLTEAQSHDALEDVLLTIKLVEYFEQLFEVPFKTFEPFRLPDLSIAQDGWQLVQVRSRHFIALGETPEKYTTELYLTLSLNKKALLFVNLSKYHELASATETLSDDEKLSCIRYVNPNKAFFLAESVEHADFPDMVVTIASIQEDSFYAQLNLNPTSYFDMIEKDWDIEYQVHKLGFDRIPKLHRIVEQFMAEPDQYNTIIKDLVATRKDPKDNYLIQLFNRVYLNYHPNPNPDYLRRYLIPRYVDGTMYKDLGYDKHFEKQYAYLIEKLDTCDNETDLAILKSLLHYYEGFSEPLMASQS